MTFGPVVVTNIPRVDVRVSIATVNPQINIELYGGGKAPAGTILDYPNPVLLKVPYENKTFLNPAEIQLIGQDKFYGSPGEVPCYDWPNPRLPFYPLENKTYLLNGNAKIGGGLPPSVTVFDYPNPRLPFQPIENKTFLLRGDALVGEGIFPHNQLDFSNPVLLKVPLENKTFLSPGNVYIGVGAKPIGAQAYDINPIIKGRLVPIDYQTSFNLISTAAFFQSAWAQQSSVLGSGIYAA